MYTHVLFLLELITGIQSSVMQASTSILSDESIYKCDMLILEYYTLYVRWPSV